MMDDTEDLRAFTDWPWSCSWRYHRTPYVCMWCSSFDGLYLNNAFRIPSCNGQGVMFVPSSSCGGLYAIDRFGPEMRCCHILFYHAIRPTSSKSLP